MKVALLLIAGQLYMSAQTVDRTKPPETPAIPSYKLPPVSESKLPNGLSIVLAEDSRFPLVTVRLAFQAGSKFDPPNLPGLSDSVATLLTQGTKTRTSRQIAEELAGIGGALTGHSTPDSLILSGSSLAENAPKLLALLGDVVLNANFPIDEVALQKQNRKQALLAQRSESDYLAREKMSEVVFGSHPYSHIGPTVASLDALDQKALVDFRDRYLTPNRAYLIVIGKLPPRTELTKMITERLGSWTGKETPAYSPAAPPESKRQIVLVDRPGSAQADIRVAKLSATYKSPELFPLIVGSAILGGTADSRLFNDIREKRGYAYDAHTEFDRRQETGVMTAVTEVRNDVVEPAMQALLDDLGEMGKDRVKADELTDTKNYLNGVYLIRLEPQSGLADQLATIKLMGLPNDYLETYTTHVRSVEPDEIEKVAKKYMTPDNSTIVVVGDASKIQKALEKVGTVTLGKAK
ncbi:MAG: insulinase family protein [Acidobacteriota bacterium]|nr:insulinase family protein [Acidobacteriota bacterium]